MVLRIFITFFSVISYFEGHCDASQLTSLNNQISFLFDQTGKGLSLQPDIIKSINDSVSLCLDKGRASQMTELINEHFRSGNPGAAMGFLIQKFRISKEAYDLEKKFNRDCPNAGCRNKLMTDLKKTVTDPRAFQLLLEAQYYPRIFHIENMPDVSIKSVTPPRKLPVKKSWMTDETYAAVLEDFNKESLPIISDSLDYTVSSSHSWRETNGKRTFPRSTGFQNHGKLNSEGATYFEYSFCDDEPQKSYSPNFWPMINGSLIGLKTYLGCHGVHTFLFSGAQNLRCKPEAKICIPEGNLPNEFKLSKEESSCFQRRLFNPNPEGRSNPREHSNLKSPYKDIYIEPASSKSTVP